MPTRKPAVFDEPAPVNDEDEACSFCHAYPGQRHGAACPEASGWVERERVWREEHAE